MADETQRLGIEINSTADLRAIQESRSLYLKTLEDVKRYSEALQKQIETVKAAGGNASAYQTELRGIIRSYKETIEAVKQPTSEQSGLLQYLNKVEEKMITIRNQTDRRPRSGQAGPGATVPYSGVTTTPDLRPAEKQAEAVDAYTIKTEREYLAVQKAIEAHMQRLTILKAEGAATATTEQKIESLSAALSTERAIAIATTIETKALAAAQAQQALVAAEAAMAEIRLGNATKEQMAAAQAALQKTRELAQATKDAATVKASQASLTATRSASMDMARVQEQVAMNADKATRKLQGLQSVFGPLSTVIPGASNAMTILHSTLRQTESGVISFDRAMALQLGTIFAGVEVVTMFIKAQKELSEYLKQFPTEFEGFGKAIAKQREAFMDSRREAQGFARDLDEVAAKYRTLNQIETDRQQQLKDTYAVEQDILQAREQLAIAEAKGAGRDEVTTAKMLLNIQMTYAAEKRRLADDEARWRIAEAQEGLKRAQAQAARANDALNGAGGLEGAFSGQRRSISSREASIAALQEQLDAARGTKKKAGDKIDEAGLPDADKERIQAALSEGKRGTAALRAAGLTGGAAEEFLIYAEQMQEASEMIERIKQELRDETANLEDSKDRLEATKNKLTRTRKEATEAAEDIAKFETALDPGNRSGLVGREQQQASTRAALGRLEQIKGLKETAALARQKGAKDEAKRLDDEAEALKKQALPTNPLFVYDPDRVKTMQEAVRKYYAAIKAGADQAVISQLAQEVNGSRNDVLGNRVIPAGGGRAPTDFTRAQPVMPGFTVTPDIAAANAMQPGGATAQAIPTTTGSQKSPEILPLDSKPIEAASTAINKANDTISKFAKGVVDMNTQTQRNVEKAVEQMNKQVREFERRMTNLLNQ